MSYLEAQERIRNKRLIGAALLLVCFVVVTISLLKGLYYHFEGVSMLSALDDMAKRFVHYVYTKTQFLAFFWQHAPVPSMQNIGAASNLQFIVFYMGIFIGTAFIRSANALAKRLRKIEEQIENEIIRHSVRHGRARSRKEIEDGVSIPNASIFKRVHELYLAPLGVGIALIVITKLLGA